MNFATPFAFDSKAVLAQDLPGNHRGGRSRFVGEGFSQGRLTGGICSTRIDFQLGTNAADTNGLNGQREACSQKNTGAPADHLRKSCRKMSSAGTGPAIAKKTAVDPRGRWSQDQSVTRVAGFIPRRYRKNAPKKRTDITASQVLVHISCADCHPTVILASPRVGACNENLSQ